MRAIVKTSPRAGAVALIDRSWSDKGPRINEAVLAVEAVGVCSTDLAVADNLYKGRRPPVQAVTLGHEVAGRVIQGPPDMLGQRVAVYPLIGCGRCHACETGEVNLCRDWDHFGITVDGGMAERLRAPAGNLFAVPETMPPEHAAILEPLSIAVHTADRVRLDRVTQATLVGPGPLGLAALLVLRAAAPWVTWTALGVPGDEIRLARAKQIGAEMVSVDPDALKLASSDLVVYAANDLVNAGAALVSLRPGGQFAALTFGTPVLFPVGGIALGELTILGVMAATHAHFAEAARQVVDSVIDPSSLIDRTVALDEWDESFEAMRNRTATKIILRP